MLHLTSICLIALHALSAVASPHPQTLDSQTLGVEFASTPNSLPILTLPYGRWRAASYDSVSDVCLLREQHSHLPNKPRILNHKANIPLDLHVQEHQICCSPYRQSEIGQAGAPGSQPHHPGWELRQCMPTRKPTWSTCVSLLLLNGIE